MINDFLSCDICQSQFNQTLTRPILLPSCGHTICQQCQNRCQKSSPKLCAVADCSTQYDYCSVNQKVLRLIRRMKSAASSNTFQGNLSGSNMNLFSQPQQQNLMSSSAQEAKSNNTLIGFQSQYQQQQLQQQQQQQLQQQHHQSMQSSQSTPSPSAGGVFCSKHIDKQIEYFCKQCNIVVCPKCMFDDHNGHQLAQLQDVTSIVKKNVSDLNLLLQNVDRVNVQHQTYLNQLIEEVKRMKDAQTQNIQNGFNQLIKRLTSRREQLINDFSKRYQQEQSRISKKQELIVKNKSEIQSVRGIYNEIVKYIEKNSDAAILSKLGDITNFVTKSIEDLEVISKTKGFDKNQVYIEASLRPLSMHVQKAFQIISKFTLVPSAGSSSSSTGNKSSSASQHSSIMPGKTGGGGPSSGESAKKKVAQKFGGVGGRERDQSQEL